MATSQKLENPVGLDGMEFVEFCSPKPQELDVLFKRFGFKRVAEHKSKKVSLYRQGRVNFMINEEPGTFAASFSQAHGPSICATGFRVKDAQLAQQVAVSRGARAIDTNQDKKSHSFPAIYGIGDSAVYFVDSRNGGEAHYEREFNFLTADKNPVGFGFEIVDHLTNNVPRGEMQKWCDFYQKIFNFREVRYFDIRGKQTGLVSKVMRSPCDKIIIPINEPTESKSQIQEYLDEYHGSGIQHLALLTGDIISSVAKVRENGVNFLDVPDTYYEMLPDRLDNVTEPMNRLRDLRLLADGDEEGYLLQIFTQNLIGPIFFEVIQRKNHQGFGEGNFQALFDSIERDQQRRGYLK